MNNFIKPPMLSTSFSESGKKAKHRFENILSTKKKKKGLFALLIVVAAIAVIGTLVACDNSSVSIIGGADGPTNIQITADNYLSKLYNSKIKYIGDNSGVSNILNLVFTDNKEIKSFELKTADNAPKGIIVNLNGKLQDDTSREAKAITVLLLVENCDYITLSYKDKSFDFQKSEIKAKFGVDFTEIIRSYEDFSKFYQNIFKQENEIPIDERIGQLIIEQNSKGYLEGECKAEGHIILDSEDGVIYALITYGEYGFQNGNFVKISGSGLIPTRITLDNNGNMTEYLVPGDGSEYEPSIKKMFPRRLWKRATENDNADMENCQKQERVYAEFYLKSIGREAKIGEYRDFEHDLPNIDTEVSNKLLDMYSQYPYWIGTEEKIENGIRYVYEKQWDEKEKIVTFRKYEYETKKVTEESIIDTTNGKIKYIKGTPKQQ